MNKGCRGRREGNFIFSNFSTLEISFGLLQFLRLSLSIILLGPLNENEKEIIDEQNDDIYISFSTNQARKRLQIRIPPPPIQGA